MWDFLSSEKVALQQADNHCRLAQMQSRYAYQHTEQLGKKAISSPVGLSLIFTLGMLKGMHRGNTPMPLKTYLSIFQTLA